MSSILSDWDDVLASVAQATAYIANACIQQKREVEFIYHEGHTVLLKGLLNTPPEPLVIEPLARLVTSVSTKGLIVKATSVAATLMSSFSYALQRKVVPERSVNLVRDAIAVLHLSAREA